MVFHLNFIHRFLGSGARSSLPSETIDVNAKWIFNVEWIIRRRRTIFFFHKSIFKCTTQKPHYMNHGMGEVLKFSRRTRQRLSLFRLVKFCLNGRFVGLLVASSSFNSNFHNISVFTLAYLPPPGISGCAHCFPKTPENTAGSISLSVCLHNNDSGNGF